MNVRYNNNTHAMLEVNALLESPMQGLHSESLWRACCVGQHCVLIHTIVRKALVKYCKRRTKGAPRRERVKKKIPIVMPLLTTDRPFFFSQICRMWFCTGQRTFGYKRRYKIFHFWHKNKLQNIDLFLTKNGRGAIFQSSIFFLVNLWLRKPTNLLVFV